MQDTKFQGKPFEVLKVSQRLVFGWGIVCKVDGVEYVDLQGDFIPEDAMLEATTDFMLHSRIGKEMHSGDPKAVIVQSWALTDETAKLFEITCPKRGWMVAMKVFDDAMLAKFHDGTYGGFSIGGLCLEAEME